ncbi:hypothetical protein AKJ16_DCAP05881 [Drosera capensis]
MAAAASLSVSSCRWIPLSPTAACPLRAKGKAAFKENLRGHRNRKECTIYALFWGQRETIWPTDANIALGDFLLTGSGSEGVSKSSIPPRKMSISVVSSVADVSSADWDACVLDACGYDKFNPFLSHGFLSSLEKSGSSSEETGWLPRHIIGKDELDNIIGMVPLYLKSHSYGEYVFDHSWADAYYSYGSSYYPKLQCCVPFTPVTGPRILIRNIPQKDEVFDALVSALKDLTVKILAQNLTMKRLRGYEITASHWDAFYKFYRNTTDNKWGHAYLTRDFFHEMGSKMGDNVLLVTAEESGKLVAGALNLIGGNTLYGRLWGCLPESYYSGLHFEACYYQAIEAAIEFKLDSVEAGAQGEHKIQRGYLPVTTYSCHYIVDADFARAIGNFLDRETVQVRQAMKLLHASSPFKDDIECFVLSHTSLIYIKTGERKANYCGFKVSEGVIRACSVIKSSPENQIIFKAHQPLRCYVHSIIT